MAGNGRREKVVADQQRDKVDREPEYELTFVAKSRVRERLVEYNDWTKVAENRDWTKLVER